MRDVDGRASEDGGAVDTHCHLLFGVDDGPASGVEAVALARALVADGVGAVVCTPHWSRQFATTAVGCAERFERLVETLQHEGIDLELHLAAELSDIVASVEDVSTIRTRSIGQRWTLVEMVERSLPLQFSAIRKRLVAADLQLVIAHPERCSAVQRDVTVLDDLLAGGAVLQVVAASLTGTWGRRAAQCAWDLLASGRATLVASDAHDHRNRRPELAAARSLCTDRLGLEAWHDFTVTEPRRLVAG